MHKSTRPIRHPGGANALDELRKQLLTVELLLGSTVLRRFLKPDVEAFVTDPVLSLMHIGPSSRRRALALKVQAQALPTRTFSDSL